MSLPLEPDGHLDVTIKLRLPIRLDSYPDDVTTLGDALDYEQASYEEGAYADEDLISMADSVETTWEVAGA